MIVMSLYDHYKSSIMEMLSIDEETLNVMKDEYEERNLGSKRKAQLLFLLYLALSIISSVLYRLAGMKRNLDLNGLDFVFISCPDTIFRTRSIDIIAHGLKYQVVYLPSFHVRSAIQYHRYFKGKVDAVFLLFSLGDVIRAHRIMAKSLWMRKMKSSAPAEAYYSLWCQLFTYLVYNQMVERRFGCVKKSKTKWLFEHQKFFFVPIVHLIKKKGIETVMLQHGCFFKPSYNYFPLYCDRVLCCSEREKAVYMKSGVSEGRITVFGAPLQSIEMRSLENQIPPCYDLLILPTLITDANVGIHIETIKYIRVRYRERKVLIRIRPRSKKSDLHYLSDNISAYDISPDGTTLQDDVLKAAKVISFSEDCTFSLLENRKPFIIISVDEDRGALGNKMVVRDSVVEEIDKLMMKDDYCPFSESDKLFLIGETNSLVLHEKFLCYMGRNK